MGRLQIEDRWQQEENEMEPKEERSTLALPSPEQVQGESSQNLPKEWKFVINHPQDQIIGRNQSSKVYKRSSQKVQHGGSQDNEDSNEFIHLAW